MSTALVRPEAALAAQRGAALLPALTLDDLTYRAQVLDQFIHKTLKKGVDYDVIPGTPKPSMLQPAAEKIGMLFGWSPKFIIEEKIVQWEEPAFFYYLIKCEVWAGDRLLGDRQASCNSHESKYRYRWVPESEIPPYLQLDKLVKRDGVLSELQFAVQKGETQGKYGKPAEYWQQFREAIKAGKARKGERESNSGKKMLTWEIDGTLWRIPNPDIADQHNTILQMAQKRAHVAAVKMVANLSERFTMDMEEDAPPVYESPTGEPPEPPQAHQESDIEAGVQAIWTAMGTSAKGIVDAFSAIKRDLMQIMGPAGESEYYRVMKSWDVQHANEFVKGPKASVKNARQCIRMLWMVLEDARKLGVSPDDLPKGDA